MSSARRSLVFSGNGWADFESIVLEWLTDASVSSWKQSELTLVAVPTRSHGFFLRELCLKHNLAFAGLYFYTPGEFRDNLLRAFPVPKRAASREELRLLLSLSAAQFPADPLARSLAADSDSLLKSLDSLWASGHRHLPGEDPLLEKILTQFHNYLDQCGLCTSQDTDRFLAKAAQESAPIFAASLIYGFCGRHWARFPILQALAHASKKSTVLLWNPPNRASEVDQLWIGTWEENFSPSDIASAENEPESPLRPLTESILAGSPLPQDKARNLPAVIRVGRNALEEARLVLAQILLWLAETDSARIAVLFPKANPCSRELSELLKQWDVPHNDTLGHASAHSSQETQWNLWLQLQEQPRLDHLRSFAEANSSNFDLLLRGWNRLDKAFQQMLTDNLEWIARWLHAQTKEDEELARIIDHLLFLPAKASLQEFIARALQACSDHDWKAHAQKIEQRSHPLQQLRDELMDRALFIRWLREVVRAPNRQRAASGHHPYARIQILTYPDAELQPWTHVIFTGLNEGSWPPKEEEGGWLHSLEMEMLNRQTIIHGNQGDGHFTVRPGCSRLITPEERRAMASRSLLSLLEDARVSCCFTAALTLPESPHREASPSDFLVKVYWALHGAAIDSETFNRLARNSSDWISSLPGTAPATGPGDFPQAAQTATAWQARRVSGEPFGPYDFCFSSTPPQPLFLPAKSWEQALRNPAQIWLERVVHVSKIKRYAAEDPGRLAEGTWVHGWLKNVFAPGPAGDRVQCLLQMALLDRRAAELLYQSSAGTLPQLWISQWEQALSKALELAQTIAAQTAWQPLATEYRITPPLALTFPDGQSLALLGTIDLILCEAQESPRPGESWAGKKFHVVDYKTGTDKPLNLNRLLAGEGVQIALYLLALHAKGAANVSGQVLSTEGKFACQLDAEEALSAERIWKTLLAIQSEIRLGLRGELRPEFSFGSDYPLATLAVDPDLIEERWNLTHPAMSRENV